MQGQQYILPLGRHRLHGFRVKVNFLLYLALQISIFSLEHVCSFYATTKGRREASSQPYANTKGNLNGVIVLFLTVRDVIYVIDIALTTMNVHNLIVVR